MPSHTFSRTDSIYAVASAEARSARPRRGSVAAGQLRGSHMAAHRRGAFAYIKRAYKYHIAM